MENITYSGFDAQGNRYEINSTFAEIRKSEPGLAYMTDVIAYFYLKEDKIIKVTSKRGIYNRITSDIFFEEDINLQEGNYNLTAQNVDAVISENLIIAYNDVKFNGINGSALADKVTIDLLNRTSKISMYDKNKKVKMKLIK